MLRKLFTLKIKTKKITEDVRRINMMLKYVHFFRFLMEIFDLQLHIIFLFL